jgi:hypothetical protein
MPNPTRPAAGFAMPAAALRSAARSGQSASASAASYPSGSPARRRARARRLISTRPAAWAASRFCRTRSVAREGDQDLGNFGDRHQHECGRSHRDAFGRGRKRGQRRKWREGRKRRLDCARQSRLRVKRWRCRLALGRAGRRSRREAGAQAGIGRVEREFNLFNPLRRHLRASRTSPVQRRSLPERPASSRHRRPSA